MSHEYVNTCSDCERVIDAEQYRVVGCCADCQRSLHKSWTILDREHDRTRDPLQ